MDVNWGRECVFITQLPRPFKQFFFFARRAFSLFAEKYTHSIFVGSLFRSLKIKRVGAWDEMSYRKTAL
uniref:Uncharacterized protein n=1 Tax=Meloidogyne enterolobii TaxID=390850 RepID=A0A6V7W7T1_MELEN|nr:unnamed protein product [Meloidogyne enterolobii]